LIRSILVPARTAEPDDVRSYGETVRTVPGCRAEGHGPGLCRSRRPNVKPDESGGSIQLANTGMSALRRWSKHGSKTTLHTTVWTGKSEKAGVYDLKSTDGGHSWAGPKKLSGAGTTHSDIASSKNTVCAVWDNLKEGRIYSSRSTDGRETWSLPRLISSSGNQSTRPRIVSIGDRFVAFWKENDESSTKLDMTMIRPGDVK